MRGALPVISTAQLAYLSAVARHRTWAEAASELGVTQSALSQGIAELERRLGIELFGWDGRRRVQLAHTATIVGYAERVLADTADTARFVSSVRSGEVGELHIGMIDTAAVHLFPDVLRRFRSQRSSLAVRVSVAPTGELLDRVTDGTIDVAICVDPEGVGMFDIVALATDELAVYGPVGSAGLSPAAWGPWLLYPASSRTRQAIDRELQRLGAPAAVQMESHQPDVLAEMVRVGLGWAVLPVVQAEQGPHPLERVRPEPLLTRRIVAATRRGSPQHPAIATLVDSLLASD